MKPSVALIVGSAASALDFEIMARSPTKTPYGAPSSALLRAQIAGRSVLLLARHGEGGGIAPHLVNYRANIWALREHGIDAIIAINAVGVIDTSSFLPGQIAVPDQLIDYTYGREQTFATAETDSVRHVEFTEPFDPSLRGALAVAAAETGSAVGRGVYGVTQGPRLETAAEIERLARDGCTMVGMTAMPEAGLARELGIAYAICAVGVNYAAGRSPSGGEIHREMAVYAQAGMAHARATLERALPML